MRKLACIFGFALLVAAGAQADAHQSAFGFSVDVPSGWLVLSQQQIAENTGAFNPSDPRFIGMDSGVMSQLMDKIKNGQIEVYFHKGVGAPGFVNNVNVLRQNAKIPDGSELKDTCDQLPGAFSQYFGHPTTIYQCALASVGGKHALLLEFDGALGGTRSIQYQIQSAEGETVVMTGTFTNGTVEQERTAFNHIAMSVKFK